MRSAAASGRIFALLRQPRHHFPRLRTLRSDRHRTSRRYPHQDTGSAPARRVRARTTDKTRPPCTALARDPAVPAGAAAAGAQTYRPFHGTRSAVRSPLRPPGGAPGFPPRPSGRAGYGRRRSLTHARAPRGATCRGIS